jgi:hypothetical protein
MPPEKAPLVKLRLTERPDKDCAGLQAATLCARRNTAKLSTCGHASGLTTARYRRTLRCR